MENASDALKIAFAVFIFLFALSLAFYMVTLAKNTADIVLFTSDKTNYYPHASYLPGTGRTVQIDTIISTLYRCKNETMVVEISGCCPTTSTIPHKFDSTTDKGELAENIKNFVEAHSNNTSNFLEKFVEINYSGKEITGDDGSSIIVSKGGTKMYITYTI